MSDTARYDLLLVGEGAGFVLADAAARAFLRNLATTMLAIPADEAVAKRWAEVYLRPGPAAHTLFVKGQAPAEPAFLEAVLHFGEDAERLPFGEDATSYFWLEIRGSLYPEVASAFRRRFEGELNARPRLLSRPHAGLPAHREVAEEDRRPEAAKKFARGGAVGTQVEEY
jgi:hypothetical protein